MTNTYTDNRDKWLQMSDIDYLGQFVKVWLAFNAWYQSTYSARTDREIIEEIKWNTNQIASKFRPLLDYLSEEAEQFRNEIGLLHNRLENYELHHGKGNDKKRIRFNQIIIRFEDPPIREEHTSRSINYIIERVGNGSVQVELKNRSGAILLHKDQQHYDIDELQSDPAFRQSLSETMRNNCLRIYRLVNPKLVRDLTKGDELPIECGTHTFRCGTDYLFAGVIEVIYLMRCTLFHGELVPTHEAAECYEPAYRIIRRIIKAIT